MTDEFREPEEPELKDRTTRAEQAKGPLRGKALMKRLLALSPAEWDHLPLEELALAELHTYIRIKPNARGALKRQRHRIGSVLQNADHDALEASLDGRRTEREEWIESLVRWRSRIIEDLNRGMSDFIEAYPSADRQRLRQAALNARKAVGTSKQAATGRALLDVLKEAAEPV